MQPRRLTNPWWFLSGAIAGGFAWAVGLPVWASALIGVIIWLTTILVFGFLFASPPARHPRAHPGPGTGADDPDAEYAARARDAAAAFERTTATLSPGPLTEPLPRMLWRVNEIAASIEHLARRSTELAHLSHTLGGTPHEHEYARYVQERHNEVRHRMHAATGDLEAMVPRFTGILSTRHLSSGNDALTGLAGELESIGYGVDIGERIADEILGPEAPSGPPSPLAG